MEEMLGEYDVWPMLYGQEKRKSTFKSLFAQNVLWGNVVNDRSCIPVAVCLKIIIRELKNSFSKFWINFDHTSNTRVNHL